MESNARNVRARYIRNAEPFFGGVGKEEAHCKPDDWDTSMVFGVALEVVFQQQVRHDSDADSRREESYHFSDRDSDSVKAVAFVDGDEQRQKNDADNIVEDSGSHDRRADFRIEFSEFFERGNRNAYARCGEDCAVKEVGDDLMLRYILKSAVERRSDQKTEPEREEHAQNSDND